MNPITINATPNSKQRTGTPGAHPMPPMWMPKRRTVKRLANELGVSEDALLDHFLDYFREVAMARDFLYRDWERAFSNCVRKVWPGLSIPMEPQGIKVSVQAWAGVPA